MRKLILAALMGVILSAGALISNRAEAMSVPAGIATAAQTLNVTDQAAYVCRRAWNGFRWVRRCFWTGPRVVAPRVVVRPYGFYRGYRYGYRPYRYGYRRWR